MGIILFQFTSRFVTLHLRLYMDGPSFVQLLLCQVEVKQLDLLQTLSTFNNSLKVTTQEPQGVPTSVKSQEHREAVAAILCVSEIPGSSTESQSLRS